MEESGSYFLSFPFLSPLKKKLTDKEIGKNAFQINPFHFFSTLFKLTNGVKLVLHETIEAENIRETITLKYLSRETLERVSVPRFSLESLTASRSSISSHCCTRELDNLARFLCYWI